MKIISKISTIIVLLALLLGNLPVQPAMAATLTVTSTADTDTPGTLRYAVNNAASGDTIEFDLTTPATIILSANLEITTALTISGPGEENLTINANSASNAFVVSTTLDVVLSDLTITNGSASNGGAIYKSQTSGELTISNVTFNSNHATSDGGAVYTYGPIVITESTFSTNTADGDGGALMAFDQATLDLTATTFSSNSAVGDGGAIKFDAKSADIIKSTFENNSAVNGGAIANVDTKVDVSNSTFYANSASSLGGAVYNTLDSITLRNTTLSDNDATSGGGIYSNFRFKLFNNILANSTSGNDCYNDGANLIGHSNLIETGNCSGDITDDPMLGTLQDNGGLTETMALLTGSPAIDAGDNTVCANAPVSNLDQRGISRPQDGNRDDTDTCDLGAYEVEDPRTATSISVTNSPVTYNGAAQAASISGSVAGTISNIQYDGSATEPTAIGTYGVTADFLPDDTYNYQSLTGASAGDFVIDPEFVAPTVDSFSAATPSASLDITISAFTASDNVAVTGYVITESSTAPAFDEAGWNASAPGTYTVLAEGAYVLYPWAKDASGNVSTAFGTPAAVTVDTTPPTVDTVVRSDSSPTNTASVDFSVTFSEPVTGVDTDDFSLSTTGGVAGESVTGVSGSGDSYTVSVATGSGDGTIRLDVLDNDTIIDIASLPLDSGFTSGQVYDIDKTAPETSLDVFPIDPSGDTSASFEFSSVDGTATFECQLDSGGFSVCTSPDAYSGLGEGEHTFDVRAVDPAGNIDASPESYTWTISVGGIIFWDDFETNDFSRWTRFNDGDGFLYTCSRAAINGSYGACVKRGTNDKRKQLIDDSPVNEDIFNARFNFDINSLSMTTGERFRFMQFKMDAERPAFIVLKYDSGVYSIQLNALLDDRTKVKTGWITLPNAVTTIEVEWQQSSGSDDGFARLYLDDVLEDELTGLDNDTISITSFRMGFTSKLADKSISGIFYIDDVATSNGGHIGIP